MPKNKLTFFQRLTNLFRSGPVVRRKVRGFDTVAAAADMTKSSGTLLFQRSLSPTYTRITSNSYNLSERLMRYNDFEMMEQTPEISSALDLWADETVSQDEKGRALHIYSENSKIKEILEDLFYNTINLEFNLRSWARNLVKFGDLFVYIDVSPEYGVCNVFPIPVNEIEREENYDRKDPFAVRFRWVSLGNRTLENWEVAHFRLLGNDTFLPYGSSVIEAARRVWRQLILIEDAMLVYRIVRAPERRVFYVDVGNLAASDVDMYMEKQKVQLRSSHVMDQANGHGDLRYNPMCNSLKTLIKLQDGRCISLGDLIKEWDSGKQDQWVYSIDVDGKKIVPGKIVWAGMTRKDAQMVRVNLDDGTYLDTTPDHRFMLRDGSYCEAQNLQSDFSLMSVCNREINVTKIEWLEQREDTGCVTIEKYHNFAAGGHNQQDLINPNSFVCLHNSVDEDIWVPVRGETGTKIETLPGGQNTAAVEDVAYIQKKLFAALKVPRAYLGYDDALSSKAGLAQEDIRFSRSISIIQRTLLAELNKIAIIHLYAHGFDGQDLQNFSLRLSNPSTVATQQKLELWRTRFEIAALSPEGMASRDFIRGHIWDLTPHEIEQIDKQRHKEKLVDSAIEAAQAPGEESGGLGGGLGGEEDFGGGEEETPTEEPDTEELPPENAAEEHEDELELLTSADDVSDRTFKGMKLPIKPNQTSQRVVNVKQREAHDPTQAKKDLEYKLGRRRNSKGASKHFMPDLNKMTSNDSREMKDPFDASSLNAVVTNPLGEAYNPPPISRATLLMLERMAAAKNIKKKSSLVLESQDQRLVDVQDQIDKIGDVEAFNTFDLDVII